MVFILSALLKHYTSILGQGPCSLIRPCYNVDVNLEFSAFNEYVCEINVFSHSTIIQSIFISILRFMDNLHVCILIINKNVKLNKMSLNVPMIFWNTLNMPFIISITIITMVYNTLLWKMSCIYIIVSLVRTRI